MSNIDNTRVAQLRQQVHEQVLEAIDFMTQLHKAGLIDGWRNVVHVGPYPDQSRDEGFVTPSFNDLSGKGYAKKDPT